MTSVGVVQMVARVGDVDANLAVAEAHVRQLVGGGASLVVLPELFGSGYDLSVDQVALARATEHRVMDWLVQLAGELRVWLTTAVLVGTPTGSLVDRGVVVGPDGLVASADKRLLWGQEPLHFEPGTTFGAVAATGAGTVGVAICYEAGFPEAARDLATRGADLIAVPAAFGRVRLHAWDLLTRSRALENGCYLLAAGLTGENDSGVQFAGHSRIVDPRGQVLAGLELDEGVLLVELDPTAVTRAREEIPYLRSLAHDRGQSGTVPA